MGFFSSLFGGGGKKSSSSTENKVEIYDPLAGPRAEVATPLSKFLAGQVGVGIGEFPTDPNYTNRYNEFLSVSPSDYFTREIQAPATKLFKEDVLPVIREGFAGSLRGSGRFGGEEAGINRFELGLAQQRGEFVPKFAQEQLTVGQTEFARQYQNWVASLPQTNPALQQAISFIGATMGSPGTVLNKGGTTTTTDTDKKDWLGEIINAAATVAAAYFSGGCWVASEIFDGWYKPKTISARYYINFKAPTWFKTFYLTYGECVASFIRKHKALKFMLRPLFELFAKRGASYGI